jgi:hypothetical protein
MRTESLYVEYLMRPSLEYRCWVEFGFYSCDDNMNINLNFIFYFHCLHKSGGGFELI